MVGSCSAAGISGWVQEEKLLEWMWCPCPIPDAPCAGGTEMLPPTWEEAEISAADPKIPVRLP